MDTSFCKGSDHVSIVQQKEHALMEVSSYIELNALHDYYMKLAIEEVLANLESPPCSFTIFVTGSGGRKEQSYWSDQDHGIIYEKQDAEQYFEMFGTLLADKLAAYGYVYCEGGIMTSSPIWNTSKANWIRQIERWVTEASWGDMRYLQIFFDARVLYGVEEDVNKLKKYITDYVNVHPELFQRFLKNMMHIKPAIGPLGQFLTERYGEQQGLLDIKYSAFLPYINCIRLLAIEKELVETSTLERITQLKKEETSLLNDVDALFEQLLQLRFTYQRRTDYQSSHYIDVKQLTAEHKKILRKVVKRAKKLHDDMMTRY